MSHVFTITGKTESRQRTVEESRSSDRHAEHAARGVRRYGRFAGVGVEGRERRSSEEELFVTLERRIPSVRNVSWRTGKFETTGNASFY